MQMRNLRNLKEPQETPCQSVLLSAVHAKKGPVRLSCLSTRLPRDRHSGVSAEEQGSGRSTRDCAHSTRDGQEREQRTPWTRLGEYWVCQKTTTCSLAPSTTSHKRIASSVLKIGNAHSVQFLLTATGLGPTPPTDGRSRPPRPPHAAHADGRNPLGRRRKRVGRACVGRSAPSVPCEDSRNSKRWLFL